MGYIGSDPKTNESVSTAQLVDDSVTNAKIVDNVLFTSVTSSVVSASGTITADTFTGTFSGALSSSAQIATSISGSSTSLSSSLATRTTTLESASGSFASDLVTLKGSGTTQGVGTSDSPTFADATITGTLTAQEIHTEFESASVIFTSGSTIFGNSSDDVHNMTGSLNVSGAINLNDGNLGIGTSSPTTFTGFTTLHHKNTSGNAIQLVETDGGVIHQIISTDDGYSIVGTRSNHSLRIGTDDTPAIYVDTSQQVGIGTASPSNIFHSHGVTHRFSSDSYNVVYIQGDANNDGSNDDIVLQFTTGNSNTVKGELRYDESDDKFEISAGDNQNHLVISSSGNVGIDETNPDGKLHIKQSTDEGNAIVVDSSTSSARIDVLTIQEEGNERWNLSFEGNGATNDLTLNSNSTNSILNIKPSGNIGIGTDNPGYLTELRVNDTVDNTPRLVIRQLGTGDSSLAFQLPNSPYGWVIGADNSDSDRFKISTGVGDLDSSPRFEIDPGGTTIHRYTGAENIVQIHSGVGSSTTGISQIYFSSKDQYGGNTHQSYIKSTIDGSSSTSATKMTFHNRDSSGTVQEYLTIKADGHVGIGTTSPSTATNIMLSVGSTGLGYSGMEFIAGTNGESWRLYTSYNGASEAIWGLYRVADSSYKYIVHENGKMGIGNSDPEGWLTINQGTNDDKILSLKTNGDLAHGVTTVAETDTFGFMKKFSNTQGGLQISGVSTHERPIVLMAYGNYFQSPGNGTGTDKCASQIWAYEVSGTGVTNIGSNESIFTVRGYKGGSMQSVFIVDIEGDLHTDGSTSLTGYDYAEYFEWTDGNPDNEDRVGYSVVLEGDKIRKATEGETPIGIISGTPAVVGDNPMSWHGAWKTDEWGRKIPKEVEFVRWEYDYQSEEGAEVVKQEQNWKVSDLPKDLEIPDNAEYYTKLEGQYSDDYDPSKSYTLREYRQEWSAVGLMGKLRLRKGQPVASTWIKMRDEGNNIEMWLVK